MQAEVVDRVFGTETRDTPTLMWMPGHITYPWVACFTGDKPEWYVDPYRTLFMGKQVCRPVRPVVDGVRAAT